MAAKGTEAKQIFEQKLQEVFKEGFVGVFDKKIYVNITESTGELVQLAIAMTCPKNPIGSNSVESESSSAPKPTTLPIEISEEDTQAVENLMAELGL